ncbi:unnamed protein product [Rhodiola kirilowii]
MDNSIIETREELIVPLQGKLAHFLNPSSAATIIDPPNAPPPARAENENDDEPPTLAAIHLIGWRNPQVKYKTWVNLMSAKHRPTWENAGIYDAIINSTYKIQRFNDLVLGFVDNWCSETNSFVFYWGECSITLEDVYVLGGFSLLGDSVLTPVENESQSQQVMESLLNIRLELNKTSAKKVSQQLWLKTFMNLNHQYEHEAFLAYWLSVFVFPQSRDSIGKHVIPIAVHLAKGRRIALAPAVLASIYRDLGHIAQRKLAAVDDEMKMEPLNVWAPFQLVQIWIWERFVHLRPKQYTLRPVEPRIARWVVDGKSEVETVNLDRLRWSLMGNDFQWRPYATNMNNNILFSKFYGDKTECGGSDDELQSFARCVRCCELVGINCTMQYLPHRVAMQFGFDQDIPLDVKKSNETHQVIWERYSQIIDVTDLYIPSPDVTPGVTLRYLEWRKPIGHIRNHLCRDKFKRIVKAKGEKTSPNSSKTEKLRKVKLEEDNCYDVLNHRRTSKMMPSIDYTDNIPDVPPGFEPISLQLKRKEELQTPSANGVESIVDVPPGFEPKDSELKKKKKSQKSGLNKVAGRRRKLNVVVDDDLSPTEVFIVEKRFEDNGLYDNFWNEDYIPTQELPFFSRKHQRSTAKPDNSTYSFMLGSHLQGSKKANSLGVEFDSSAGTNKAELLQGKLDICITSDKHVAEGLADFNVNEPALNLQQCTVKEGNVAVSAPEQQMTERNEKKEKAWIKLEREIEILARQIEIRKADARARGHNIP